MELSGLITSIKTNKANFLFVCLFSATSQHNVTSVKVTVRNVIQQNNGLIAPHESLNITDVQSRYKIINKKNFQNVILKHSSIITSISSSYTLHRFLSLSYITADKTALKSDHLLQEF